MNIALTHAEGRLIGLEQALEQRGFDVLRIPLVRTEVLMDANVAPLLECSWWLFTSTSAVESLVKLGVSFAGHRIGVVGEATARAIRDAGGTVELVSHNGNASGLANDFLEHVDLVGVGAQGTSLRSMQGMTPLRHTVGPIGIPQGDRASNTLHGELERHGLEVSTVTVYRTITNPWPANTNQPDVIVLASPSAVDALPNHVAREAQLIALGPTTAATLHARHLECVTASSPSVEGVLEALESLRLNSIRSAAGVGEASLAPTKTHHP